MWHLVARQDAPDGRRIQSELGGENNSTALAAPPGREHLLLDPIARAVGYPNRPRRTVGQRGIAALGIPTQPFVHRCPRNPQLLSHVRGRPAGSDTLNDQPTSEHIGTGVSVRHKDLLRVNARHIHSVRRSAHFQAGTPSTTSQVATSSRVLSDHRRGTSPVHRPAVAADMLARRRALQFEHLQVPTK
jgi:hypothetical protein